ncbi:MAG: D-alanyl-D-alanine carboxypeptidase family protein [Bacillota bacterium]
MRLGLRRLFFLWIFVFLLVWPVEAWGQPKVTADAAALMDADTGVLFYAKNGTQRREPASLTKIMTCILAMELADPGEEVTVSRRAARVWVGSDIDLRTGERIKLGELLKAALICSANDATVAVAEGVAGDHDTFVRWMNARAVLLGMRKTNFVNTNGYSHPSHYSTAADLAVLTRYALRNPYFASLVRTRESTIHWVEPPRKLRVRNTNRLLHGGFPGLTGVKTGTTDKAGQCLIASASLEGRNLIAVVLHSDGRYWDAKRLLAWGMEAAEKLPACNRGEYYTRLRVHGGRLPDVPLVADRAVTVSLPREQKDLLQKEVRLFPAPAAPVELGQRLGEVIFRWQDQELGRAALVAGRKVEERPWYWSWRRIPF